MLYRFLFFLTCVTQINALTLRVRNERPAPLIIQLLQSGDRASFECVIKPYSNEAIEINPASGFKFMQFYLPDEAILSDLYDLSAPGGSTRETLIRVTNQPTCLDIFTQKCSRFFAWALGSSDTPHTRPSGDSADTGGTPDRDDEV